MFKLFNTNFKVNCTGLEHGGQSPKLLPKKKGEGGGEIPTLEEWTIRTVIIFVKTRAIRVTEIGNTVHGGSCRRKFWFRNKPEVSFARRNDTFVVRSLTTHTYTHTHTSRQHLNNWLRLQLPPLSFLLQLTNSFMSTTKILSNKDITTFLRWNVYILKFYPYVWKQTAFHFITCQFLRVNNG